MLVSTNRGATHTRRGTTSRTGARAGDSLNAVGPPPDFRSVPGVTMARVDTRRMKGLRTAFFNEGKRLDADPDTRELANCWLCKQRIDYTVDPHTTPDSHNLDHRTPVSIDPSLAEDVTGFRHSHMRCNLHRGNRAPSPGLGEAIPDWF